MHESSCVSCDCYDCSSTVSSTNCSQPVARGWWAQHHLVPDAASPSCISASPRAAADGGPAPARVHTYLGQLMQGWVSGHQQQNKARLLRAVAMAGSVHFLMASAAPPPAAVAPQRMSAASRHGKPFETSSGKLYTMPYPTIIAVLTLLIAVYCPPEVIAGCLILKSMCLPNLSPKHSSAAVAASL